jgi:hypothetical protein
MDFGGKGFNDFENAAIVIQLHGDTIPAGRA